MVERVALIFAQWGDAFSTHYSQPNSEMEWDDYSPTEQLIALAAARAVIEALMEPTPQMLEAAVMAHFEFLASGGAPQAANFARFIFQAMLRTALSQPNEEGEGK